MRVNVYAEEITDRVEIVTKTVDGQEFTGVRFYLELPVTVGGSAADTHRSVEGTPRVFPPTNGEAAQVAGPFMHRPDDDDSSAVTFWGKKDISFAFRKALELLDTLYASQKDPT